MKKKNIEKIMESSQSRFDEYAELLARRDQLNKEAGSILTCYTQEFGEQLIANFKLKLECIKMKKNISYCRRMINRGVKINVNNMTESVEKEMALYNAQLADMQGQYENAKKSKSVGEFRFSRSKKIYRRLSKLVHPDMNKLTEENEDLQELWNRIVVAYHESNVEELDDLEILVHKKLEDLGVDETKIEVEDIEERIERVERQINDILSTEPYTFREVLADDERKADYHNTLNEEHSNYEEYLETLKKALNELLLGKGMNTTWEMN